jgi:PadR family transcriptional regulator AphA
VSSPRLGPTSYLVLGMIALRGPSTPYELKRAVGRSVGYFWPFPHTQFYDEPARLAEAGLLTEQQEREGRRRRTYAITERGLEALRAWLGEPTTGPMEIRDIGELKLFFSELVTAEAIVALAHAQRNFYRRRVAELEAIAVRYADRSELACRMAPLRLGLRLYRAAAEFWAEIAERPPQPGQSPSR